MRRIGILHGLAKATRFRNYLLTQQVDSLIERGSEDGCWEIWVQEEDDIEKAKVELAGFQAAPDDARFAVDHEANRIRQRKVDQRWKGGPPLSEPEGGIELVGESPGERPKQNEQNSSISSVDREPAFDVNPLLDSETRQSSIPVTITIVALSVIASFSTNFAQPRGSRIPGKVTLEQQIFHGLTFVDQRGYDPKHDSFAELKKGEAWRVFTPMFLHGNMFHLLFNMFFIFLLGSMIERIHGSLFFLFLALFTHAAGMMVQVLLPDTPVMPESLRGSPFAIGASGAAYGFFGFMWIRPWLDSDYPIELDPTQLILILSGLIVCMTPVVKHVANGAHLGGLAAGVIVALASVVLKR